MGISIILSVLSIFAVGFVTGSWLTERSIRTMTAKNEIGRLIVSVPTDTEDSHKVFMVISEIIEQAQSAKKSEELNKEQNINGISK